LSKNNVCKPFIHSFINLIEVEKLEKIMKKEEEVIAHIRGVMQILNLFLRKCYLSS